MRLVSVAVPVPYLDSLTYNVPDRYPKLPPVGSRVRVPVGKRLVVGCVVGHEARFEGDTPPRDVAAILDEEPFLPPEIVQLCGWVADYYIAGYGDSIAAAMPPGSKREDASRTHRIVAATAHGMALAAVRLKPDTTTVQDRAAVRLKSDAPEVRLKPDTTTVQDMAEVRLKPDTTTVQDRAEVRLKPDTTTLTVVSGFSRTSDLSGPSKLTTKQREALEMLAEAAPGLSSATLRDRGITADVVRRLAARGLVTIRDERSERDPFERAGMSVARDEDRQLTDEQQRTLATLAGLADSGEFKVALLHGVTGSGKTEIYLRLAEQICRGGRQVLLMVPEIGLTPSVSALFRSAFGERVAIQHSALSDGERHDQWQRIRRGEIDVVVGTRSAVFTPLRNPGLIVVDEEHDSSYKQEESPRYHGRDVAIVRARTAGALVVLGSATPSMESYQNAVAGKYVLVTLERRVLDRPLAAVRVVNMRDEYAEDGPDVVISRALGAAVEDRLARGEQVLVLLNRRGYATAVLCRQCGDTFECPNCSLSLTVHRARNGWRARCHYCNYSLDVPKICRKCAAPYLEHTGFGTEKIEQQLRERFPQARVERVDRDSVRRKGALTSLLSRFAAGEIDMLVGTQMIAKGHDFPRVTLVGVISADVGLGLADFRAAERTFQLLTQVVGRAGRGEQAGEAVVQTLYPEHYSIQLACRQDYAGFFEHEFAYRRGMRYPPTVALVNGIIRGRTFDEAMRTASEIVRRLGVAAGKGSFLILGPAPAPFGRLRGEHRVQFLLKGTRRVDMRHALRAVLAELPEARRKVTIDVDPLSVL